MLVTMLPALRSSQNPAFYLVHPDVFSPTLFFFLCTLYRVLIALACIWLALFVFPVVSCKTGHLGQEGRVTDRPDLLSKLPVWA